MKIIRVNEINMYEKGFKYKMIKKQYKKRKALTTSLLYPYSPHQTFEYIEHNVFNALSVYSASGHGNMTCQWTLCGPQHTLHGLLDFQHKAMRATTLAILVSSGAG